MLWLKAFAVLVVCVGYFTHADPNKPTPGLFEGVGTSFYRRIPDISLRLPLEHEYLQPASQFAEQVHITAVGSQHVAINWVTPRNPGVASKHRPKPLPPSISDDCTGAAVQSLVQVYDSSTPGQYKLEQTVKGSFTCYSTPDYESGLLHLAIVGPLKHEAVYSFQCGDPNWGWSSMYTFKTLPPAGTTSLPFRLGFVGDLGQTKHSRSTLQHLQDSEPGLVVNLGDLSYADGDQTRWDSFGRLVEPFFSQMLHMTIQGNHEVESYASMLSARVGPALAATVNASVEDNAPIPYDKHFLAYELRYYIPAAESKSDSRLYYSFDVAGAHIVMLGCYTDFSRKSAQYSWLVDDLKKVDRSKTPWLIVGMHAPWYNSNTAHQQEMAVMRHSMERLLHKHRADLVFTGHVHSYERSRKVFKEKHHKCAPIYIVIGDGGNREGLSRVWEQPQPKWSAFRESSYGHGTLDMFNSTHALWRWMRNHDHTPQPADSKWIVRDVERCFGKPALLQQQGQQQQQQQVQGQKQGQGQGPQQQQVQVQQQGQGQGEEVFVGFEAGSGVEAGEDWDLEEWGQEAAGSWVQPDTAARPAAQIVL